MRTKRFRKLFFVILAFSLWTVTVYDYHGLQAASWPDASIKGIVPWGAGGGTDRQLRGLVPYLSDELKVPVIVENKPGASGMAAAIDFVKNQPKDGSVFLAQIQLYLTVGNVVTGEQINIEDLSIIAGISEDILGIHIKKERWKNLGDFIKDIQKNPGKFSIGFMPRAAPHVALAVLEKATGIKGKIIEVPYQSGGKARIDLLGGHIDAEISGVDSTFAAGGDQLQTLGLFSTTPHPRDQKIAMINDELTRIGIKEKVPDLYNYFFYALHNSVKEKYPDRWNTLVVAFKRAINNPKFIKWFETQGWTPTYRGPEEGKKIMLELDKRAREYTDLLKEK